MEFDLQGNCEQRIAVQTILDAARAPDVQRLTSGDLSRVFLIYDDRGCGLDVPELTPADSHAAHYKELGLFQRYAYERKDGKPLDPGELHFSLRYDKDDVWGAICRRVLLIFAGEIDQAGYRPLAADLREKIAGVQTRIEKERTQRVPRTVPQL